MNMPQILTEQGKQGHVPSEKVVRISLFECLVLGLYFHLHQHMRGVVPKKWGVNDIFFMVTVATGVLVKTHKSRIPRPCPKQVKAGEPSRPRC